MLAISCQLPVPNDPKSRKPKKNFYTTSFTTHLNVFISWAKFQHTLPSAGAKGASFSLSLTPLLPFRGFLFLFFSVLPPPLTCPWIRRSPGLKILHDSYNWDRNLLSSPDSWFLGTSSANTSKQLPLPYTDFPKNRNALWFRKVSEPWPHPKNISILLTNLLWRNIPSNEGKDSCLSFNCSILLPVWNM